MCLSLQRESYVRNFMSNQKKMNTMKKSYLLPIGFKKVGLWMALPFVVLCVLCLCGVMDNVNLSLLSVKMPALVDYSGWFTMNETNLIDEIAMFGLLVSLVFIGLSRERDEDEMTAHIRMQSFVWSAWATSAVIALGIFFVYDLEFVTFMFVAMYLYLMLYAAKFNLAMYRERKEQQ